ncbi:MAG: cyclic nucleotide-binding domain-containing protein [Halothece sp.]
MSFSRRKALLILGSLNNDDLDWMLTYGRKERLDIGKVLIYKNHQIQALYMVLDGLLSVCLEEKEVAEIGKGEVVGEISFIDNRPPVATVKAKEKSSVLAIPRLALTTKLQENSGFAARFYQGLAMCLCDRMRSTTQRLGYGSNSKVDSESEEVIEAERLRLELAQAKFDWLNSLAVSEV